MSDLLTREEYGAISDNLTLPRCSFVDGSFRKGNGGVLPTINPATGEIIAELSAADASDVDYSAQKAREAFDDGRWSKLHPASRKEVLIKLAKLIKRNRRELAVMESLDSGKPIADCEQIDIPETINTIKWHAEAIDKLYDKTAPVGDDAMSLIVREPVGVVGLVLPWNFPLLMLAWKLAPALAARNSLVIKPAEQTSLTALRLAELAMEAGVPAGIINVLVGDGPSVGQPIGLSNKIDMIGFTGSTDTGRRFLRYSADSNLKNISLECGGKNPAIVLEDADQLDIVAEHIVSAAFWNMGENCSAGSRLIVHKSHKEELLSRVEAHLRDWRTGDPLDPANALGALIDSEHFGKVSSAIDSATGKRLCGEKIDGKFITPTIFDGVKPDEKLAQEEVFGPVLAVVEVSSTDEALAVANMTDYGLAASIFSANIKTALRASRAVRAGTVTVNCFGEGDITTPFGGFKQSGFWGRDNSLQAHDQYCETKTIWIDLSDRDGDHIA